MHSCKSDEEALAPGWSSANELAAVLVLKYFPQSGELSSLNLAELCQNLDICRLSSVNYGSVQWNASLQNDANRVIKLFIYVFILIINNETR